MISTDITQSTPTPQYQRTSIIAAYLLYNLSASDHFTTPTSKFVLHQIGTAGSMSPNVDAISSVIQVVHCSSWVLQARIFHHQLNEHFRHPSIIAVSPSPNFSMSTSDHFTNPTSRNLQHIKPVRHFTCSTADWISMVTSNFGSLKSAFANPNSTNDSDISLADQFHHHETFLIEFVNLRSLPIQTT